MDRINAPAQRVEIKLPGGEWIDITTAVRGFVVPRWRVERKTGVLISDQVRARVIVPFLEDLGLTVRQVLEAAYIDFRLYFHEATSSISPTVPVFRGKVVELARLTLKRAGDALDLKVYDLLEAGNQRTPAIGALTSTDPIRYDEVVEGIAEVLDLTVGEFHGTGLSTDTPYITHHPRPGGADATVQIRGLAWWSTHGLLVCGINESIWGYSPSTGTSYELARPPWPAMTPIRQVEHVWVDGTDVYGVSLPTEDAPTGTEGYIVKADLSAFDPSIVSPPVQYTVYDEPFKLWNAGRAAILAAEAWWFRWQEGLLGHMFSYVGSAIGLAGPVEKDYKRGPVIFETMDEWGVHHRATAWDFRVARGGWGADSEWASDAPLVLGRNVYLPTETFVDLEYTDTDLRTAEVTAYRMPGYLSYYIPSAQLVTGSDDHMIYDLGNGLPYAEEVGELPRTLPAGYYAFITHGQRAVGTADDPYPEPEPVSGFKISFTRAQRRPAIAFTSAGDTVITAEDTVDIDTLSYPLGPLVSSDADEFERLYHRDLSTGAKTLVVGFPQNAHSVRMARRSDTDIMVAFAQEVGLPGAYNRTEPLTRLVLGRVKKVGSKWVYSELSTLGGWTGNDDGSVYHHFEPTTLVCSGNSVYVGYTRSSQRFVDIKDAQVYRAYVDWEFDGPDLYMGDSVVEVSGYIVDDLKVGDRVRLWPDEPTRPPYAPLSRTIFNVEWDTEDLVTRIKINPPLDCSDGAEPPAGRVIRHVPGDRWTTGLEEYDARYRTEFDWGPPTLQREAEAREVRTYFRAYYLSSGSWGAPIDYGREDVTEELTAEDDAENQRATLFLSQSFPDTSTIEVKLGDTVINHTVDTEELYETGECTLGIPRRFAGLELSVTYSHWDISQRFDESAASGSTVYYTRGKELRSWSGSVIEHGEVHYKASGTASPLVIPAATVPVTVYGVAEGGGNYPYQLSVNHSLHVGDRSGWIGKGLASCLAEVALALGCVFWVDGNGVIHFRPRGWRGDKTEIPAEDILDYQEPGAWQRAAPSVTVSWPGGSQTAGVLSATRLSDNESVSAPLVTSASWANLLANHLYAAKKNNAGRAEVVLAGLRLDIEMGDGLKLPLTGSVSPTDGAGTVVGIEPVLNLGQAQTKLTLELTNMHTK
jgi:hypothetical protein